MYGFQFCANNGQYNGCKIKIKTQDRTFVRTRRLFNIWCVRSFRRFTSFRRRRLVVVPIAFYEPNTVPGSGSTIYARRSSDGFPFAGIVREWSMRSIARQQNAQPVCGRLFRTRLRFMARFSTTFIMIFRARALESHWDNPQVGPFGKILDLNFFLTRFPKAIRNDRTGAYIAIAFCCASTRRGRHWSTRRTPYAVPRGRNRHRPLNSLRRRFSRPGRKLLPRPNASSVYLIGGKRPFLSKTVLIR